jgi:phage terminase large subunit
LGELEPDPQEDAVDDFFAGPKASPKGATVVQANWRDNPLVEGRAEGERQLELERYPERYDHTYEGDYARAFEGAYFAGCSRRPSARAG